MNSASPVWTIYLHTHRDSGRGYVGLTKKTWRQRWDQHVCQARKKPVSRSHWYNAIQKYGKDAFDHMVLHTCSSLDEANLLEWKWIEILGTRDPAHGFNITPGGKVRAPHLSRNPWDRPEYRAKMESVLRSGLQKARWQDPALRAQMSRTQKSRFVEDPSLKERVSRDQLKRMEDPQYRAKIMSGLIEQNMDPDRSALSAAQKKRFSDPDELIKKSLASRKFTGDPEYRQKMRDRIQKLYEDPEYLQKVRAAIRDSRKDRS
ncbi:MAG: GIY-YIG catalytic domain protein [Synergistetes bacterium ADurb.BinA166]|nr:MAG: GIY-YIG catalytic domain protein [Synergistetes bacterium ADurb.BinA166]